MVNVINKARRFHPHEKKNNTHTNLLAQYVPFFLMAIEIINANIHHIFLLFSANTNVISSIYEFIPCQWSDNNELL